VSQPKIGQLSAVDCSTNQDTTVTAEGGGRLARSPRPNPCLLNIPAFDCVVAYYNLSFDLQQRKIMENLCHAKRKALG
jgi:hypothetical protein